MFVVELILELSIDCVTLRKLRILTFGLFGEFVSDWYIIFLAVLICGNEECMYVCVFVWLDSIQNYIFEGLV